MWEIEICGFRVVFAFISSLSSSLFVRFLPFHFMFSVSVCLLSRDIVAY